MTKKKAATKKITNVALIVFGTLEGKQRAGTFVEADAQLAKRAATQLGLSVLEVTDEATKELSAKLRPGNAHANASGFLPVAPKALYMRLSGGLAVAVKGKDGEPHLPKSFQDIRVGSVVASHDSDPADGMWLAVVKKQKGDMFTLRWKSRSERSPFIKHRFHLALLWPGEDLVTDANGTSNNGIYPANFASIDVTSLVLAVEDGPIQQLWPATVVEATGRDTLKLKWRDYPEVPAIERTRHSLALMYPNPGAIKGRKKPKLKAQR